MICWTKKVRNKNAEIVYFALGRDYLMVKYISVDLIMIIGLLHF